MWTSSGATTLQCNTSASLAAMLEKEEMSFYRRYPPNKVVPLAEYIEDRRMLIEWCNTIIDQGNFRSPNERVQVVSGFARTRVCQFQFPLTSRSNLMLPRQWPSRTNTCQ